MRRTGSQNMAGRTRSGGKCPICGKSRAAAFRPFCSKRCADIDLSRWLSEAYVVAGEDAEVADEAPSRQPGSEDG